MSTIDQLAAAVRAQDENPAVETCEGYSISLRSYDDIDDDVPTWAWTYDGKGRIPLGALTLFAGRPGAGKSTAARWFAAQVTRGTLPGQWQGTSHPVAYIAGEESPKYSVKPSLRAAGADMSKVLYPSTILHHEDHDETRINYIPPTGMRALGKALRDAGVKLVIVDPMMTMMGGKIDINRNNEVRDRLQPWVDLAGDIDGVVIGITHLNKSGNGDVLAGINGSSAFGELCRAAFGFAKDDESDEGHRVMSQEKNSLGVEDLALTYTLTAQVVTTASGKSAEMPRFTIVGESEKRVGDILRAAAAPVSERGTGVREVVVEYLRSQPGMSALAEDVKAEVLDRGCNFRTAQNQREKWGVQTTPEGKKKRWTLVEKSADTSHFPADTSHTRGSVMCDVSRSEGVSDTSHHTSHNPPREDSHPHLAAVPDLADDTDRTIWDALGNGFPLSARAIASAVPGSTEEDIEPRLQALVERNLVTVNGRGKYERATA